MAQLTIEPLGETVDIASAQTILDACLRAGVWLPHACGHGLCGTCKIEVLEGEVDHGDASSFALMDFERDEGKALACTARPLGDCVIEADLEEDADAERFKVSDHAATVARVEALTPDIRGIWLSVSGEGIRFQAGQYVNVQVPGLDTPRAFSIASSPSRPREIELHVRRVPGGRGTGWLHERLEPGTRLAFAGPYGRFHLRRSVPAPMLFLAGGSGLSSPKSMILDLIESGDQRPITLIHGVRRPRDLYSDALFRELAAKRAGFRYLPVISDPVAGDGWSGEVGFVHQAAERLFEARFDGWQAYLCGPPPMIEACIGTLMRGRLFERNIHTESFVTAGDAPAARSPLSRRG